MLHRHGRPRPRRAEERHPAGTGRNKAFGERRAAVQVPARFDHVVATSVGGTIGLPERHGPGTRLLAGGHGPVPMMKLRPALPETLIAVHELDTGLHYIREDDALEIDALAWHQDVLDYKKGYELAHRGGIA